jgi:hypothetical protein
MALLPELERGFLQYWDEVNTRTSDEQVREHRFPYLAVRYASRQPPHFDRQDLGEIILWKYTDKRRRKKALSGLSVVEDATLEQATATVTLLTEPTAAARLLTGVVKGVGIAGASAVLAAAYPDRFPVIDMFALAAIERFSEQPWISQLQRDAQGRPQADIPSYTPYTRFCRSLAEQASARSTIRWFPRHVDMALWALGKGGP